jgi:hypothetical protein
MYLYTLCIRVFQLGFFLRDFALLEKIKIKGKKSKSKAKNKKQKRATI